MVRLTRWYTTAGVGDGYAQSGEITTRIPECTILRIEGSVLFDTNSPTPPDTQWLGLGWQLNVGVAAGNPLSQGFDDPGVMIRKVLLVPGEAHDRGTSPIPVQDLGTEGRRIVAAGETLWFAFGSLQAAVGWLVAFELRALCLLPEGVVPSLSADTGSSLITPGPNATGSLTSSVLQQAKRS